MKQKKVKFKNEQDIEIAARLDLPVDQHPRAFLIFAHCFTCSKDLLAVKNISRAFTAKGFAVLRFDFTGLGHSDGDFEDTNFSTNISDLVSAAAFLEKEYQAPKLLVGHSLGGAAVLVAARQIKSIEAVATIGAPSCPNHVSNLFGENIAEIKKEGVANVDIGGRPFRVKKQFLEDFEEVKMQRHIKQLKKPLAILHSPQDSVVEIKNAEEIYSAAMHPKTFISLDGADHLLSQKEDSNYVGNIIAEWALRYLKLPVQKSLSTDHQVMAHLGEEGFTTDILAGKHRLKADEPEDVGGDDFGPSPYDFLLSALGACTAMTLRMYAQHKKWGLKEVQVHMNHKKEHVHDSEQAEKKSSKIDLITRNINLIGELSQEQKQRLLEIANKCPVHKTLNQEVKIESQLDE